MVRVTFWSELHVQLGTPVTFALGPYGIQEMNQVLRNVNGAGVAGGASWFNATVEVVTGTLVYPYASIYDNGTNDPFVVTPLAQLSPSSRLGGIVRTPGKNGTNWRSDVVIYNPSARTRNVNVGFSYVSSAYSTARLTYSVNVSIGAGQSLETVDVVKSVLPVSPGVDGSLPSALFAYMDVKPASDDPLPTEPLLVLGKTYNETLQGSVGTLLLPVTPLDALTATGKNRRLILSGLSESPSSATGKRTNIAVLRATNDGNGASATIRVLNPQGIQIGTQPFSLGDPTAVNTFLQFAVKEILDAAGFGGDRTSLTVVIDGYSGTAPVVAYATVVDNVTSDSAFILGVPVP